LLGLQITLLQLAPEDHQTRLAVVLLLFQQLLSVGTLLAEELVELLVMDLLAEDLLATEGTAKALVEAAVEQLLMELVL
jgi:hypothetical protein